MGVRKMRDERLQGFVAAAQVPEEVQTRPFPHSSESIVHFLQTPLLQIGVSGLQPLSFGNVTSGLQA